MNVERTLDGIILALNLEGLVFDLDGTLTHTLDQHIEAFHRVFSQYGYTVNRDEIKKHMGRRPTDITRDMIFDGKPDESLTDGEKDLLYEMAEEKIKVFKSLIPDKPPLMPGLPDLLVKAKERCMRLAVCSSTPLENVRIILDRINLLHFFDEFVTAEDVRIGKPHPEAFLKAVEKLKVLNTAVIVIGDSIHDIRSARQAGLRIIAVATGKHPKHVLEGECPMLAVNTLAELL